MLHHDSLPPSVAEQLKDFEPHKPALLNILLYIQDAYGFIPLNYQQEIAAYTGISLVDLRETLTFYHFLSDSYRGRYQIYVTDNIIARHGNFEEIIDCFDQLLNISPGEMTADGMFGLYLTPCVGMNDQETAILVNGMSFPAMTPLKIETLVGRLQQTTPLAEIYRELYSSTDHPAGERFPALSAVKSNIQQRGTVLPDQEDPAGEVLKKALKLSPEELITQVIDARLRGRGGAGFSTGRKWQACRNFALEKKQPGYIICNADEGEPGTFKDRVLLTERPAAVIEGMLLAGYATGSSEGIIYLRYEYSYLRPYLETVIESFYDQGLLGTNILNHNGFNFDISIQMGAGSYVCGEETALIESLEGNRGEPRIRPPFPVESGYLGCPTAVNNVETYCQALAVVKHGSAFYRSLGTDDSPGTKLLSISGDCSRPGVYEVEWGLSIREMLKMCGGEDAWFVVIGGASGPILKVDNNLDRTISYSDVATGGSVMIFSKERDVFEVALNFTQFFIDETCGSCVTCRNGTITLRDILIKIQTGHGRIRDLRKINDWGNIIRQTTRCGLGATSSVPILSAYHEFEELFEDRLDQFRTFSVFHETDIYKRATSRGSE